MLLKKIILLTVLCSLFLGGPFLNLVGYTLNSATGPFYFKIHPATYLALMVFLFTIIKVKFNFLNKKRIEFRYIYVVLICVSYQVLSGNSNSLSFIGNTLLCPALLLISFPQFDIKLSYLARTLIVIFLITNSFLAIFEKVFVFNLFPLNHEFQEGFRSTAFQGHPLNNALIVSIIIAFIYICEGNLRRKRILIFIGITSLICFGIRGALYVTVCGLALHSFFSFFIKSKISYIQDRGSRRVSFNLLYVLAALVILTFLTFKTKLGERLINISYFDEGSAGVRIAVWKTLDNISFSDLVFGIDEIAIANRMHSAQVAIIENFWILWLFKFGLIFTTLITISLFFMLKRPMKNLKRIDILYLFLVFVGVASTNNSLASNTTAITVFAICSFAFLKPIKQLGAGIRFNFNRSPDNIDK